MTAGKFASITASILARKGEAKPWQDPDKQDPLWQGSVPEPTFSVRPATVANLVEPSPAKPAMDETPATPQKKYSLRMSFQEYEQLGILAVKKDCTRQQLLRDALAQLFTALARDYRSQCPCLERCGDEAREVAAGSEPVTA